MRIASRTPRRRSGVLQPLVPKFHDCIVCEGVREEVRGKLTILGFLGLSPHVDVHIQHLDRPTGLCFLMLGDRADGSFKASFEIVDVSDGRKVLETPLSDFVANLKSRTLAVLSSPVLFGRAGTYAVRFYLDGTLAIEGKFDVQQGPPSV